MSSPRVVIDRLRRVLIAQRPAGKHLAGAWEFPGGKLEPGEAPGEGLARELREEIGITIRQPRPLIRVRHAYPHGEVLLDVWVVRRYRGKPRGLDGQRLRWCNARELLRCRTAAGRSADPRGAQAAAAIAARIDAGLPSRTSFPKERGARTPEVPRRGSSASPAAVPRRPRAAAGRADFLVLREAPSCRDLAALCGAVPVPVFVPGMPLERAWALGASGINAIVC